MQLLIQGDLARLKSRYAAPEFGAVVAKMKETSTREMTHPLDVPSEGAGWVHDYTCPTHATRLIYDRDKPHEHVCEVDGEVFTGGVYDEAWRAFRNAELIASARSAALVWVMSGDEMFRQHAVDVLMAYARNYPDYPVHGTHAGQGRVMGQSLDEAVWAIPAAWTFDLLHESLPTEDETYIRERLLRGLGDHLLTQLWTRIHNIQCWHLAGLATIGVVLDDERYILPTFDPEWGMAAQIQNGIMEDGWWWEGSPHYHFYTSQAMTSLGVALRYRHPELLDNLRLKRMFSAPLEMLRPDFSLPAFNDGWFDISPPGGIAQYVEVFERVHAFWGQPIHAQAMSLIYDRYTQRDSLDALLFGPETLPDPEPLPSESTVHEASGYVILNSNDTQLLLKYGPHGGGHGHTDKLALVLWGYGQRLSPDLGTPGYGIAMNFTWYKQTVSHNTVLTNSTLQPELTGELVRFETHDGVTIAEAVAEFPDDSDESYAGVRLRRTIHWTGRYFVDVVQVTCPQSRQIDLAWHHAGVLTFDGLAATDVVFTEIGYEHLSNARSSEAVQWQAVWRTAAGPGSAMWALNPSGTTTLVCDAPYNPASETMSLILRRVRAESATFISVVEPFAESSTLTSVEWHTGDDGTINIDIQGDGIADQVTI